MKIRTYVLRTTFLTVLSFLILLLGTWFLIHSSPFEKAKPSDSGDSENDILAQAIFSKRPESTTKKARSDYYLRMLRDPKTGKIPRSIRKRELAYSSQLPNRAMLSAKRPTITWQEAGPNDVGGRTRALAVDRTNSNVILTGGVAGGIWKSIDGGASWELKSDPDALLSVTFISQDPRPGNTQRWFATTGEFVGSNSDRGFTAPAYGQGLYMSEDSGETWESIASSANPTRLDSPFDIGIKVLVSPVTGTIFTASQAFSINRIVEPGMQATQVLGTAILPEWTDFDIASDGSLIAVTGSPLVPSNMESPGVFYSTNDGVSWEDITPDNYPSAPGRSVITFAPSDPSVAYLWTFTGQITSSNNAFEEEEEMLFYKISLPQGTAEDRTANLPNFGGRVGQLYTQGGYDMVIAVKPDDPNDVFIGGTNLYRSRDGFATSSSAPGGIGRTWIGGYAIVNNVSQYSNHHPDQHALFFVPQNPNALWSGHDGGLSFVSDVVSAGNSMPWQDMNNGYNVTQFYHVALSSDPSDDRILGGTQDNGSPFFRFDTSSSNSSSSNDLSSGDGGYAYLGATYGLASTQLGELIRLNYSEPSPPLFGGIITPPGASNQLFINPFAVDQLNERVVYYPGGAQLWRGTGVPVSTSWSMLSNVMLPQGYIISTLSSGIRFNDNSQASVLYLGASGSDVPPQILRLDDATSSTMAPVDISIAGAASDAYVHGIAVNPEDGDEILVVFSNYNITGLYHSTDGGASYAAVEGNLEGTENLPGPSLRSAAILPLPSETLYVLGTSTGVYSTNTLSGDATTWTLEAASELGHGIVEYVTVRPSDGRIAVATHGRGIFIGSTQNLVSIEDESPSTAESFALHPNYPNPFQGSTTITYSLKEASQVSLNLYDVSGRLVRPLLSGSTNAAGSHSIRLDAGTLPSGTYIYKLEAVSLHSTNTVFNESRVMVLAR